MLKKEDRKAARSASRKAKNVEKAKAEKVEAAQAEAEVKAEAEAKPAPFVAPAGFVALVTAAKAHKEDAIASAAAQVAAELASAPAPQATPGYTRKGTLADAIDGALVVYAGSEDKQAARAVLVESVKGEALRRGYKPYTYGQLRSHLRYRHSRGLLLDVTLA